MSIEASAPLRPSWPHTVEQFDLLTALGPELSKLIIRGVAPLRVPAAHLLYQPGDDPVAFIVQQGLVRAFYTSVDGREATVVYIHDREAIGLVTVLTGPVSVSVQAVTPTSLLPLNTERLVQLATADGRVALALAQQAANSTRKAMHLVALHTLGSMHERLAFDLMERGCQRQLQTGRLEVRAGHAELASSVGTSREVVTRVLASFRSSGLVRTERGVISILDADGLAAIYSGFPR